MSRPIHFEIHAEDPERASRFYRQILGWEISKWEGPIEYWTIKTGVAGTPGGKIALPKQPVPGIGWLAYAKDTEGNLFGFMQADPTAH